MRIAAATVRCVRRAGIFARLLRDIFLCAQVDDSK
jgi:hypothetical protein